MDTRLTTSLEGRYTIDREIGRGGMATVYLARDIRHKRNVALKVLNPELGAVLGSERFLSEIQVTANLQHPNLLPLFDSGAAEGLLFYVMPYVEGESLRARLQREKQLPVDEAIRLSSAVASALDYAHRHGVIHRDLKPENILLHEGQPLIADFGIALAVSNAGGERITQTGLSLGTPQYMSPEQATGDRVVDGRTDIYSLGALTYEMLVGDPPYIGSTAQAIIAKVLTEKPRSVRASRSTVPTHVEAAIERALEKLPADRWPTAHEYSDALQGKLTSGAMTAARTHAKHRTGEHDASSRVRRSTMVAATGWVLAAGAALWLGAQRVRGTSHAEAPVIRAVLDLPPGDRVQDALVGTTLAVSPQGDRIAYTSTGPGGYRTFIRRTSELLGKAINAGTGTSSVARSLAFSPDGRWIAFAEGNEIKKAQTDGGSSSTLGAGPSVPRGLAWTPGDTIVIGSTNGLFAIPAGGGTPTPLFKPDPAVKTIPSQVWPVLSMEGDLLFFATGSGLAASSLRLAVASMKDRTVKVLQTAGVAPLGLLDDHLIYINASGAVMALPFDVRRREPRGEAIVVEEGVIVDGNAGAKASLSASGTFVFLSGRSESQPVLVTSVGNDVPLIKEAHQYGTPRYSPDGRSVAITEFGANTTDIYVYGIDKNTFTRLTTEGVNVRPEWTPDGKKVLFRSDRNGKIGIWWQPADGSGPAELLYQPEQEPYEAVMSPDAKWLIFRTAPGSQFSRDIFALPLEGERKPVPLVVGPASEQMPRLSPDGKWLVYQSDESGGRFEIYVRPFPAAGARVQVSDQGGIEPIWSRSGRSLIYRSGAELVEVPVTTGASFSIGQRQTVLRGEYLADPSHPNYDVAPDGKHFLMLKRAGGESKTIIVHNWVRELREKLGRSR